MDPTIWHVLQLSAWAATTAAANPSDEHIDENPAVRASISRYNSSRTADTYFLWYDAYVI